MPLYQSHRVSDITPSGRTPVDTVLRGLFAVTLFLTPPFSVFAADAPVNAPTITSLPRDAATRSPLNQILREAKIQENLTIADEHFRNQNYHEAVRTYFAVLAIAFNSLDDATKMMIATRVVSTVKLDNAMEVARQAAMEHRRPAESKIILAKIYHLLAQAVVVLVDDEAEAVLRSHNSPRRENRLGRELQSFADEGPGTLRKSQAASLYLESLAIAPNGVDESERLRIANWLTSIDRADAALQVLLQLVSEQPGNVAALLSLVRTRILLEQYQDAVGDADHVLAIDSQNQEAGFLKATALQKQRRYTDAISQYNAMLHGARAFNARIGLSYVLVNAGRKQEAGKLLHDTYAENEAQEYELYSAKNALARSTHMRIDVTRSQFEDSDKNMNRDVGMLVKGTLVDWDLAAGVREKTAIGETKSLKATTYSVSGATNVTDQIRINSKLGRIQLGSETPDEETTGQLKVDAQMLGTKTTLNYSREVLTATTLLIEKNIQMTQRGLSIAMPLPNRISLKASATRKSFSDDNIGDDYQAVVNYRLTRRGPMLSLGLMYHYLNFEHASKSSYFDPQNFASQQIMFNFGWEGSPYYFYLEMDLGQQEFTRHTYKQKAQFIGYGNATGGVSLSRHWTMELSTEWSNSSSPGMPESYGDTTLGARLSYMF